MNGTPFNPPPVNQPPKSSSRWILVAVVGILLAGGIVYLLFASRTSAPGSLGNTGGGGDGSQNFGQGVIDADMLQQVRATAPGNSVSDIDEDIASTDLQALDEELQALDEEMKGL